MTTILFIWYLLTTPTDKLICSLWVNQPPSRDALVAACGTDALGAYRMDVVPLEGAGVVCSRPADALYQIRDVCNLTAPLDHYRIRIIKPDVYTSPCSLALDSDRQPTEADIASQCPAQLADWKAGRIKTQFVGTQAKVTNDAPMCAAPNIEAGPGLYQQASSPNDLTTHDDLTWLAGRLIWFGLIKPACGGASGLDPVTLAANPCGVSAARPLVLQWQNQFDGEIYNAALSAHVPARLLKRMMLVESQMWPLYTGADGESGVLQVTPNGADVLLRYDPQLAPSYLDLTTEAQTQKRYATQKIFDCAVCSFAQAVNRTRELIPMYARLLAAYRCRAVEITPSLGGMDAWRQATADYNGSMDYLHRIEQ